MGAPLWCPTSLSSVPTQDRPPPQFPATQSPMAGPRGWCHLVFFMWAYECQAQTAMWSGSGPHDPFWLDILKEASASPDGCRGALGPKPAQCPLTSWQAGSELGLPGQGWAPGKGSQAAEQAPPQTVWPGPAQRLSEARGAWALRAATTHADGSRFPFLSFPRELGPPSGLTSVGPDAESSVNSAHPAKSQDKCLSGG